MGETRFDDVTRLACSEEDRGMLEGDDELECTIDNETGEHDVNVSVVTISDMHPYGMTKFSQDRYDQARDQEYSADFISGTCILRKNPKGNPSLTCTGSAEEAF